MIRQSKILAERIENRDVEYYLQVSAIKVRGMVAEVSC
jgi:hypothetical protein